MKEWLTSATKQLENADVPTARLDCLVLLEDALSKDRSYLLAHPETEIKGQTLAELKSRIERRAKHEPLAYIRGKSEFYGRTFKVSPHTLQPRPETETIITLIKKIVSKQQITGVEIRSLWVVDVGTGSGCVGITVKLGCPEVEVIATDVSEECLEVARKNAESLGADVEFYCGDLLQPAPHATFYLPASTLAIVANLPYVPNGHSINDAAMHEPKLAIFGGEDGLDLYRKLFKQIEQLEHKPPYVLTESLPFQHEELAKIARDFGYKLKETEDFIQVFTL